MLEASLQINLLLTSLRLLQTSLGGLLPIGLCISVHDMQVVNTVCPILPDFPEQKVSLLFCVLWRSFNWVGAATGAGRIGLRPLHGATLVYEGVVAFVRRGEGLVLTLLEASLQVHLLLTLLRLLQKFLGGLLPIGLCISYMISGS